MPVRLYMDVHVPRAITDQLRRRGVDALTAQEDGQDRATDAAILARSFALGRLIFTQDIRFHVLAQRWQQEGRSFGGLLFAHQTAATIGDLVRDLELIAKASDPDDWINATERLPL